MVPCRDYLPSLLSFASSRRADFKLNHLSVPRFFYGDVADEADDDEGGRGRGVLVLEDLSTRGFRYTCPFLSELLSTLPANLGPSRTHDHRTMLLDLPRMEAAVSALAEFHALSNAFQQSGEGMK